MYDSIIFENVQKGLVSTKCPPCVHLRGGKGVISLVWNRKRYWKEELCLYESDRKRGAFVALSFCLTLIIWQTWQVIKAGQKFFKKKIVHTREGVQFFFLKKRSQEAASLLDESRVSASGPVVVDCDN